MTTIHRYRGDEPSGHSATVPLPEVLSAVHDGQLGFASLGLPGLAHLAVLALTLLLVRSIAGHGSPDGTRRPRTHPTRPRVRHAQME